MFFAANDGTNGVELWKSDGTEAGTLMYKDLRPMAASSNPQYLTEVNGELYFAADDGVHGVELWGDVDPTFVFLLSFTAQDCNGAVCLAWQTAMEVANAGFNLWRLADGEGDYVKINAGLIPAEGGPFGGAEYQYVDDGVAAGLSYWYRLEAVDLFGQSQFFGPVSVTSSQPWQASHAQAAGVLKGTETAGPAWLQTGLMFLPVAAFVLVVILRRRSRGVDA